jgi:hypothetical protein
MRLLLPALLLLAVALAGCDAFPLGGADDAWVVYQSFTDEIIAPDTVSAGTPFDVVVVTYGSDGCHRLARTSVRRSHIQTDRPLVQIEVFNKRPAPEAGVACTTANVPIPHPVRLQVERPGTLTVSVDLGRLSFSREVVVVPR